MEMNGSRGYCKADGKGKKRWPGQGGVNGVIDSADSDGALNKVAVKTIREARRVASKKFT